MKKLLIITLIIAAFASTGKAYNNYIEAWSYNADYPITNIAWFIAPVKKVQFEVSAGYQKFHNGVGYTELSAEAALWVYIEGPSYHGTVTLANLKSLPYKRSLKTTGTYTAYADCMVTTIKCYGKGMQYVFQLSHGATSAIGWSRCWY